MLGKWNVTTLFLLFFSGVTQELAARRGLTETVFHVTMDNNAQDQTHVKMVCVKEPAFRAKIFVNTATEMTAVFILVMDMLEENVHAK